MLKSTELLAKLETSIFISLSFKTFGFLFIISAKTSFVCWILSSYEILIIISIRLVSFAFTFTIELFVIALFGTNLRDTLDFYLRVVTFSRTLRSNDMSLL